MKFGFNKLLAACAIVPLAAVHSNPLGCATPDSTETDFFPHKVEPAYSEFWDISYHGTYKIFTNKVSGLTYLLYQCGTEPPAEELDGRHANVLSIPPQDGVNVAATPMITYLELLGVRPSISGYIGYKNFISSSCFLNLIDSGSISVAEEMNNETLVASAGISSETVTLVNGYAGDTVFTNTIVMQEYEETSYISTMEWIKVYGAIFNLEDKANEIFDEATCRFDEIAENVASVTTDMPTKPKVLWAYYSEFCGGWDVAGKLRTFSFAWCSTRSNF